MSDLAHAETQSRAFRERLVQAFLAGGPRRLRDINRHLYERLGCSPEAGTFLVTRGGGPFQRVSRGLYTLRKDPHGHHG